MYTIELIQRVPGSSAPKVMSTQPSGPTSKEAILSAYLIFTANGESLQANGYQVRERKTGNLIRIWYSDNGSSAGRGIPY